MRILNALIRCLQVFRITPKYLDADIITKKAIRKTGFSDLGDNMHREGMDQLVKAVNAEPVTGFGKLSSTGIGVEAMSNRLMLIDYLKKHPEVKKNKIERPIFIVGFPRTGTTLLQNLLHLSDDYRALPFWEISNPVPRLSDPEKDVKKRKNRAKMRLAVANLVVPEMKFIHEVRHNSLEECWPLMISQFTVSNWDMTGRWPSYGEWMLHHDMKPSYQEYKSFLKLMLERIPDKNLILKCPDHMWYLDDLLEVFPDACIVWTHRDPSRSIPSYCSLASLNWRLLYGEFEPKQLGPYIEERFFTGINRALSVREKVGEEQFVDVNFQELLDNPVQVINKVTAHFNLNPVNQDKMKEYLTADRPDDRGKHNYAAEYYGVDCDSVKQRFKFYTDRFKIAIN
jgi:hypothetical protein